MKNVNGPRGVLIGAAYRFSMAGWLREKLGFFNVLEVTVDHCIYGDVTRCSEIFQLVNVIPITAHGVGLSLGTDVPLDLIYLDEVAVVVEHLKAPHYSEHLAFTRIPGRDLANLLPLPKTEEVAEQVISKVKTVQSRIGVPFLLENITYMFEWPDSKMSDAAFLNLICRETGAGLLLDVENVFLNSRNHNFDPRAFLDELDAGLVQEIHMAGGVTVCNSAGRSVLADTHSHPIPEEALDLLSYALTRHRPQTIILERDDRLDEGEEILDDIARIRARVAAHRGAHGEATFGSTG